MERRGQIITDEGVLSVAEVHYSLEDWEFIKNNKAKYDTNDNIGQNPNIRSDQAIRKANVAETFKTELNALQKQKGQLDTVISDLRAGRIETTTNIETVRNVEIEDHKDSLAVLLEPKIEEDDVNTQDLNMTDENANEMMLPTDMSKDLSKKVKKRKCGKVGTTK